MKPELQAALTEVENFIDLICPEDRSVYAALATITEALGELEKLKSALRKFTPSKRDPLRCLICEELRSDHYAGPFSAAGELHCSKYYVPRAPPAPVAEPRAIKVGSVWRVKDEVLVTRMSAGGEHARLNDSRWVFADYLHRHGELLSDPEEPTGQKEEE